MSVRLAAIFVLACLSFCQSQAASAVALALDPKTKEMTCYGYYKGSDVSEAEARKRAIAFCLASGCEKPRIIASTPRRGYGAIMGYYANGKMKLAVVLAAPTAHRAHGDVLREARLQAGKRAWLVAMWNDS